MPPAPAARGGAPLNVPRNLPPRRVFVHLDGLLAVHAARAVHTALAGVPGVRDATVTLAGAELTVDGGPETDPGSAAWRAALEAAVALGGGRVRAVAVLPRTLPLLGPEGEAAG